LIIENKEDNLTVERMPTGGRFEGETAIVTGAARGIGKAIALRLAREGAGVVVNDVAWSQELEAVAAFCNSDGSGGGVAVLADLSDSQTADRLVATALERFGSVSVLVNNAFWEENASVLDATLAGWERTLQVTLTAAMLTAKAALPTMLERTRGAIVNVSSAHALLSGRGYAAYEAAKAGLLALTRSSAVE
jgi:NAD(P)-dependent dehydrogenase (short-subunit alcohol dehydrogenase family)